VPHWQRPTGLSRKRHLGIVSVVGILSGDIRMKLPISQTSQDEGVQHRDWADLNCFPNLVMAAVLCLVVGSLFPLVFGEVVQTEVLVPEHVNHTFIGRSYTVGDFVVRVDSVGDVIGSRQVIVWLDLFNNASAFTTWVVNLDTLKIQVDGGEWRPVYYSSTSEVHHGEVCGHYERLVYRHRSYRLDPGQGTGCWVVFELSKYEFDTMKSLGFEWSTRSGKITGRFNISGERVPEDVPYIEMIRPKKGETTVWLGSIEFQVLDLESRPVNWSVEFDGEFLFEGTAPARQDPCPILVERSLEPRAIPYGPHRLVLRAADGKVEDVVVVEFVLEQPKIIELVEEWAINTSAQFGFTFGAGYQGSQTVWDIDGDGVKEIVFGTRRGHSKRLWAFDAGGSLEWVYPPIDQDGLPGDPTSKVSLVDVNGDGVYELCLAGRGGRLHVLDGNGRVVWVWDNPTGQAMHGAPQALDVDGDGLVEFFINDNAGFIHRVSHEGELVWTSFQTGAANMGQPTIADIDQDGGYEVLWASSDHYVYSIRAEDAFEEWRFDTGARLARNQVIVADVNKDGEYEALVWTDAPASAVICLTHSGEELWRWTHPRPGANIRMCQALGDVDKDGSMDMVVMTTDAAFLIDIGGVVPLTKWEANFSQWSEERLLPPGAMMSHWSSYQTIADIDGDGELEILWLAPYPIVTDGETGMPEAFYLNDHVATQRWADNGGWWGDVDQDGVSEWICELRGKTYSRTQIYCLTLSGQFPAESPWPEYYHSAYPAEYQNKQDWLTLKAAYSNSLWFPIPDQLAFIALLVCLIPTRRTNTSQAQKTR